MRVRPFAWPLVSRLGMVLADDLLGNGEVHLVVATTSGRLLALTTSLPLLPLAAVYVAIIFFFCLIN